MGVQLIMDSWWELFDKWLVLEMLKLSRTWWHTPLIPALRRQRQVDFFELMASLVTD